MNQPFFASYFLLAVAIADFVIGLFVLLKNSRRLVNQSFFIFALGIASWSAGIALIFKTHSFFYNQVIFYGALLMFAGLLFFARVFPDKDKINRGFWLWMIPLGVLMALIPLKVFVAGIAFSPSGIEPINGPGMPVFAVVVLGYMVYSIFLLIRTYHGTTGLRKMQMQYLFLGLGLFIFSAVLFDAVLPAFGFFALNLLGPGSSVFLIAFTGYAIVRHQLMDIDVIIRRGTVFTLLFGTMITILTASTAFLSSFLSETASQLITAFLLTIMFVPTRNVLERLTDRVFFRKGYHIDEALTNLNHILVRTTNLDHLSKNILNHIGQTLKVSKAMMFVAESQEEFLLRGVYGQGTQLKKLDNQSRLIRYLQSYPLLREGHEKEILTIYDVAPEDSSAMTSQISREQWQIVIQELIRLGFMLVMPIFAKRKLIGVILLDEKKSGDYFSNQDMRFLDLASHEIAFSIENGLNVERLMRVDEVKSEFITVVSHQLRTPLSVSRWNFELLLSGAFGEIPKKIREVIEGTHMAMMDLNQGVNNLMTALEIEEGKVVTHFESVSLNEVVDDAMDGVQQELGVKNVVVERDFGYTGVVNIDRHKIQRVLEILLDNAARYSNPGSKIFLKTEFTSDPDRELRVSIEDFGIGIDPKNHEVIFQKFFRGDQAKKASPGGFGLGLFISKAYIELHGGKIGIQPKEGSGSIMYFTIPVRHPNTPESKLSKES